MLQSGVLVIDKPAGLTSHDVVARLRRILGTKKIGHTGTLDPFATGVLVMLVGRATRLARFLDRAEKEYEALIRFGFETDTGDRTGTPKPDVSGVPEAEISEIVEKTDWDGIFEAFRGEIEQIPPMYSAKKVRGKKLYELARRGVEIERRPVPVRIDALELLGRETAVDGPPAIRVRVVCSAGTYIRTLAEEIGRKTGLPAHLGELRRTRAGRFAIAKAISLEDFEKLAAEERGTDGILIPMSAALGHLPQIRLTGGQLKKIQNGMKLEVGGEQIPDGAAVRLVGPDDGLAAIGFYERTEETVQPKVVLV